MTVVLNTFTTAGTAGSNPPVGNRQEIDDVVSRITPEDTPVYSMIGKGTTKSISPEWEIDTLRAPAANVQVEGDDYAFTAITPAVRVKNWTQIFRQGWIVSRSQEAVDNVGDVEKAAEKKVKSAIEVRKDIELQIVTGVTTAQASAAGTSRKSGTLNSWLVTNTQRAAGSTAGGYSSGTSLTVAPGNGTANRAFTKALLDTGMQQVYNAGGNLRNVVLSPYLKSVFVTFMSDTNVAPFRQNIDAGGKHTIMGSADAYQGPFGTVAIIPDRVMNTAANGADARNAFLIDPELLSWVWLRPLQEDPDLAKTGDAKRGMIIGEGTLKVRNEAGLGVISDLFGYTASSPANGT
jgi:hypothetical protein